MNKITVIKANGDRVLFNKNKLTKSLQKSGAPTTTIQKIVNEISSALYNGITTKQIYKIAMGKLKQYSRPTAARYKLKKAILELGPTGYPFERFVGELLKHQGYTVKLGVIQQGHCVTHEVDVVAQKDDKHFMIECKYHASFNTKCNVKIPLYIHSRFLDLEKQWLKKTGHEHKFHQGWVVNNTRFTEDAITYGNCAGLKLLSWDYPEQGSLKQLISIYGLYPITCLNTLTKAEKETLLNKNFVLCMHLCNKPSILSKIGISKKRQQHIMEDAHELCKSSL